MFALFRHNYILSEKKIVQIRDFQTFMTFQDAIKSSYARTERYERICDDFTGRSGILK